jgi:two-component system, sporulation sensor kinase E
MDSSIAAILPLPIVNLSLATIVYWHDPKKATNRTFALFVLAISAWSLAVRLVYFYGGEPTGIIWGRMSFVSASLIGTTFFALSTVFPDQTRLPQELRTKVMLMAGACLSLASLTPLILSEVKSSTHHHVVAAYGPFYPLFGLYIVVALSYGGWILFRKWRTARGRNRLQLQYLWLGLMLFLGGAAMTNLIIPSLTGSSRFGVYGPYFSLFLVGLATHAIIRHRLMDMRVVIRQSVTYGVSAGAAVGIIWGLLFVMDKGLGVKLRSSSPFLPLMIGVAGAIVFHPVRTAIQHLFDCYCYRQEYDYRQAIRTISQVLASLLRLDPLCEHLTSFILTTLKVEEVAVYLCHDRSLIEQRSYHHGGNGEQVRPGIGTMVSPSLIALLGRLRQPLLQDELPVGADVRELEHLHEAFTLLHSKVFIPLLIENQVAGFIAVGEKRSGDPFFTQDLEFLATIGHQAGTALKRAQLHEEITWMKEYNESILRHMESGLVVVNHDNLITVVNEAAARMLGIHAAALVGQPPDRLIPDALGMPLLDTLLEKRVYTNHEVTLKTGSGQTIPVILSTSILRGADDQPGGAILAFNDLSQIKALEEEKHRIERLASIGAFMSGIAHEIKNPLVAIKTLAELLPEQYDDEEFRDTFTKVTLNEVDRIDTLVRRLRSLSTGSTMLLHPISVITPLEETLSLISGELTRRHIKVVRDYQSPAPVPLIMGDRQQLKQVFVNLCLNSVEAIDWSGTLTVTVRSQGKHVGRPSELIIQIADTGPGIPAEHLSNIFDPFFTLKDQGTGLGLAICRGIIDYHRGSIAAANKSEGSGAIFTVKLPVAQGVEVYESTVAGG